MSGVFVVAALEEELQEFSSTDYPLQVVTGVGKVNAALGVSRLAAERAPSKIVFVGTAGSPNLAPGVYRPGRIVQHDLEDIAEIIGRMPYQPILVPEGDPEIILGTSDRFMNHASPGIYPKIMFDMEGYAYAAAAEFLGVPYSLYKAVTDDAGHNAASSWKNVIRPASSLLSLAVRNEFM